MRQVSVLAPTSWRCAGWWVGLVILVMTAASCEPKAKDAFVPPDTPPFISLSQTALQFTGPEGVTPAPQTVSVQNLGARAFSGIQLSAPAYTAGQPTNWLTVSVAGSPAIITAVVDPSGLLPGTYSAIVSVSDTAASNGPVDLAVTYTITPNPVIGASSALLRFTAPFGGANPAPQTVQLTNDGGGSINGLQVAGITYGAGQPINWLTASLSSATTPSTLTAQVAIAGLPVGQHNATIRLTDPAATNSPLLIPVTITVSAGPIIELSSSTVNFSVTQGAVVPAAANVTVSNGGGGSLTGLSVGQPAYGAGATGWLDVTLSGGSAPATISVQVTTTDLPAGQYIASIPVLAADTTILPQSVIVNLDIAPPQQVKFSNGIVNFTAVAGATFTSQQSVVVSNVGAGSLAGLNVASVTYAGASGWLQTQLSASQTPATLRLRVDPTGVPVGQHTATVTVSSSTPGSQPGSMTVNLAVSPSAPSSFVILSGNNQSAGVGTLLPVQLKVRVFSSANTPVANQPVTWNPLDGTLSAVTTTTNTLGEATATWQLGLTPGQQHVQVQTPGLPGLTFTATASSVPTGGYPNEPPGAVAVSDRSFDAKVEDGWTDRGDSRFSIVSDGSAPKSLPNIGRALFPLGYHGGTAPIQTGLAISGHTGLYVSFWIRFSPNWDGHSAYVNKIIHLWINGGNKAYLSAQSQNQSPLVPEIRLQGINENPVSRNLNPNVHNGIRLQRGQWHRWEFVLIANSAGNKDGVARWWIDGVLAGDYNDIGFVPSGGGHTWTKVDWTPTWGGTGDVVPADQTMDIDHIYVSQF